MQDANAGQIEPLAYVLSATLRYLLVTFVCVDACVEAEFLYLL